VAGMNARYDKMGIMATAVGLSEVLVSGFQPTQTHGFLGYRSDVDEELTVGWDDVSGGSCFDSALVLATFSPG